MEVIDYLNANIQYFNVELLEMVFDVQNTGNMLDAKQTSDFLQSVEANVTLTPIAIKKEPREMRFLYFVDLTESSDTEGRFSSCGAFAANPDVVVKTGRKRKQRAKSSPGITSAKKRSKEKSTKPRVTKKLERIILMSPPSK